MGEGGTVNGYQDDHTTILQGDAWELALEIPHNSVHCIVTSPPYWGLRDYGHSDQFGLEPTPQEYVAKMVDLFDRLWPVLRDDGTVWLNLGDSYAGSRAGAGDVSTTNKGNSHSRAATVSRRRDDEPVPRSDIRVPGLKAKDLVGIPWRVAFALQDAGWYLRRDIIWAKKNCMPESVTDRPTTAHEYLFLLTKRPAYYYDADAIREPHAQSSLKRIQRPFHTSENVDSRAVNGRPDGDMSQFCHALGANKRSVWHVATAPFKEAHFATFPPDLIRPCILAGTSEYGVCPTCGAPWERITEKGPLSGEARVQTGERPAADARGVSQTSALRTNGRTWREVETLGWRPTCECGGGQGPRPATVLDPFMGSGTTAQVARQLGRDALGFELNPEYIQIAADHRLAQGHLW